MSDEIPSGLLVLHGNRSERLADTVAGWLARQPLAPLEPEILLVQSNGMAEWLKMTLADTAGVCAAARVELPARFQWWLYRQVLGRDGVPAVSPLDKDALTWRLVDRLPALSALPVMAPVAGFLHDDDPGRLLQLARRLADLFDQYQVYRADWLEDWLSDDPARRDTLADGHGQRQGVPADQAWQPVLWRALVESVVASDGPGALAALRPRVHRQVLRQLQDGTPTAGALPRRVVLFGMTHVPRPTLELLSALATRCQVVLAVPNPCRFHWADIIEGRELLRQQRRRHPLREGRDLAAVPLDALHLHAHPLLAAWGRQGRDFIRQLDAFDDAELARQRFALPRIDLFDEEPLGDAAAQPWLLQVQTAIRDLLPLDEHPHTAPDPADGSIVFHLAHSAMREVEVLHDQLLALLAALPAPGGRPLAPRDIVVMVPDIEAFAPAVRAVFGQYPRHDARHIPFDIADLGARQSSPLVVALGWLLRLPQQRCTVSELRDLLEVPALAARFDLPPEALPRLAQWMSGSGWRWGLDEAQRGHLGLQACGPVHSAAWALRRMLLGFASGPGPAAEDETEPWADVEPYAEVAGLEAAWAGGLAQLLATLQRWWSVLEQGATVTDWVARGRALLADLFRATTDDERQALQALDEALVRWQRACELAGLAAELPLAVMREAWLDALEEPALDRRFRAGGVTFCTLMPMRAIPFEVVCLLGMNEGDYPRRAPRSDFDLMGQPGQARPGDRARRDDDRQLMLEALLSARRVLYVSWTGRSVRDNSAQPPSVLVSQLRDYLAAGWAPDAVARRTHEHPLQPFSRRYFEPASGLLTYAREWRQAHRAADAEALAGAAPRAETSGAEAAVQHLDLDALAQFLRHPVRHHFRRRLGVVFDEAEDALAETEPFRLDGLDSHGLVQTLLQEVGQALDTEAGHRAGPQPLLARAVARQVRQGRLPLGAPGRQEAAELGRDLGAALAQWQALRSEFSVAAPHLPVSGQQGGLVLQDWLQGLRCRAAGDTPVLLELRAQRMCRGEGAQTRVRPDLLVRPWLAGLAAAASGQALELVIVGRDATLRASAPAAEPARTQLDALLEAWQQGLHEPLPVALRTALAWLDGSPAAPVYEGNYQQHGEVADPCLARVYPDFEQLSADGRFEAWAARLYAPLRDWVLQQVRFERHPGADSDEPPREETDR